MTKGALYHHFPSKTALGYAAVGNNLDVTDLVTDDVELTAQRIGEISRIGSSC